MPDLVRKIAAGAAITLGCAHLLYGVLAFKALTPDHIWFAGAGIAMICVGLSNWRRPSRIEAAVVTVYLAIMVSVMPLPQVFVGLVIFITLMLPTRRPNLSRRRV